MQRLVALILVLALAALAPGPEAAAQDRLGGTYQGVKDAAGARIDIQPDAEGFTGTFHDAQGRSRDFAADRLGEAAEAVLDMGGSPVLLQVSPMPYGAEVVIIPIMPDGRLDAARGRIDTFVRPGLEVPPLPAEYVPPPLSPNQRITGNSFLASYEFWSPAGVRNGYLALADRTRTMMRFFPAVQLDVIFKLCLAPSSEAALAHALRGQGVDCPQVVQTIANLQRTGRYDAYKAEVGQERTVFRTSVRCGEGYRESRRTCDDVAQRLGEAAVSLRTAASVLARYR